MAEEIFDLDAEYAAERREPFRFRWADQDWELPHFTEIDWRAAGLAAEMGELADSDGVASVSIDVLQKLFAYAFGEQASRWDDVVQPAPAMVKLFSRWQRQSGTSMGESPASTDSSASTGRPSKPTSTATTASRSARRSTARATKTASTRKT